MADNGAKNGHNKLMNLLDQYVPVRTLLTWGFIGFTAVIGGAKIEALMVQQFDTMSNQIINLSEQNSATAVQIRELQDTIKTSRAARDAQMNQLTAEFTGLADKVDQNQDDNSKQIGALNARISSIVNDMAVLKCRVGHC